jgi:hypothetical protein
MDFDHPLSLFSRCNFSGEDTFSDVMKQFGKTFHNMQDYILHIGCIPNLKKLVCVHSSVLSGQFIFVSLQMSLQSFADYCNNHPPECEIEYYLRMQRMESSGENKTVQSEASVSTKQYDNLSFDSSHVGKCSEESMSVIGFVNLVTQMYHQASLCAERDIMGRGLGLPPPQRKDERTAPSSICSIPCEFMDTTSHDHFTDYLSEKESVKVRLYRSVICCE